MRNCSVCAAYCNMDLFLNLVESLISCWILLQYHITRIIITFYQIETKTFSNSLLSIPAGSIPVKELQLFYLYFLQKVISKSLRFKDSRFPH